MPIRRKRWQLAHGRMLDIGGEALIMGILNVTPDSFSDGGLAVDADTAVARAHAMREAGAAIIDIGGESTRPGAEPVAAAEEQRRILPVIEALAGRDDMILSVDTWRGETARLALAAGAHIANDVWGLQRDATLAEAVSAFGAGVVIMHTGRDRQPLADVIDDQRAFLGRSLSIAREAGIEEAQIVLDPGFGFAKYAADNLELMARFGELAELDFPWLVGVSRKRFLGEVTGRDTAERDVATAAACALLRMGGAAIFRVHEVGSARDALRVADAVLDAKPGRR